MALLLKTALIIKPFGPNTHTFHAFKVTCMPYTDLPRVRL